MSDLIIELERTTLPHDRIPLLRKALKTGGLADGRMAIGDINHSPEMIYLLWHDSGEVPVSMITRRESLDSVEGMQTLADEFLLKWSKRFG
jgi:hypothetical protein